MWTQQFNHRAAVAAAQNKASELRARATILMFAHLIAVVNRGQVAVAQRQLKTRRRGLLQFILDPYRADSLVRIASDSDRRTVLEAGTPS